MSYIATTACFLHTEDKQNVKVRRAAGSQTNVVIQANSGNDTISLILSNEIAWEVLAQLADQLEELQSCELCCKQPMSLPKLPHVELVDE